MGRIAGALSVAVVAAACTAPGDVGSPAIASVTPPSGLNTGDVTVTITGENLMPAFVSSVDDGTTQVDPIAVTLEGEPLGAVRVVAGGRIEAIVPAGLAPGLYDVEVQLGERSATLAGGYRVLAANCYAMWLDGTIRFAPPVPITEINSTVFDRDPYLSDDELTVWVSSGRDGTGRGALLRATRASLMDPFSTPVVDTVFDSPEDETKLSITADGLYAVVGSNRTGSLGVDVWESNRASINDSWPVPVRTSIVTSVNTDGNDHDPTISRDGLRLYVAPTTVLPQRLSVAVRATRTEAFSAAVEIPELLSSGGDADPSPTPDERILLFSSSRSGGPLDGNLWYATRGAVGDRFSAPVLVPDVNTDAAEGDPHLSSDGCRLYFSRDLGGDNWDIFVATALLP